MKRLLLAAALAMALTALTACSDEAPRDLSSSTPPSEPPSLTACTTQPSVAASVTGTSDLGKKPEIEIPDTAPPCGLVVGDIVPGSGAAAETGKEIVVKYVGVTYADGKEFDASWNSGRDFPFSLGGGQVIPGWDQGIVGMKVGGRRQLTIPPDLAYGPGGRGPIPPNATLVFVVDLVKVG